MPRYHGDEELNSEQTPLLREQLTAQSQGPSFGTINGVSDFPHRKTRSVTLNDVDDQRSRLFPEEEPNVTEVEPVPNRTSAFVVRLRAISVPRPIVNILLAGCTVLFMVAYVIVLPLYTGAFSSPEAGSDAYLAILLAALWFPFIFFGQVFFMKLVIDSRIPLVPRASWSNLFVVGFTMAMNGILLGLSSPPNRTPPNLQSLLQTMLIPCTVLARLVILRKGVSRSQFGCLVCLFIGLFISLEPSIFQLDSSGSNAGSSTPWYFTLMFGLSWLPAAVGYVFVEKGQKPDEDSMVYMAWVQVFLYSTYVLMVWADFLPVIGMASSPQDFFYKLKRGFICLYGGDSKCSSVPWTAVIFIFSYSFGNMFNLLLIRYADSAVYSVVVLALVTPLSTIFWTLFSPTPSLHWRPVFDQGTIYLLVGLVIMMPSVVMYSVFSNAQALAEVQEETEARQKRRQRRRQKVEFSDKVTVHEHYYSTVRRSTSAPCLQRISE